ncbi:MAG: apolipoprotein N-acyltransferase [Gammaproteobacteria bacterium]|nr:apolipoprotein N-acyltransferase [Gammaproteobacteria bacterium]
MTQSQWVDKGWRDDLCALVAGVLFPLAFAPFHWFPLSILALALLFGVWRGTTPRRAAWRGWLFGVGQFGVGVSWVYVAIHDFGYASVALAGFMTALFVVLLALFPALLGYAMARLPPLAGIVQALLVFPAGWTLFEWLRGWVLTGFPWLHAGYSQIDAPLAGLAPIVGVYGVSWAAAFSAGVLLMLVQTTGRARYFSAAVLLALWLVALLAGRVVWTQAEGVPLRAALVQGNIPQDIKWQPEQVQRTLERYLELTRQHWDSDLVVWPEAALPVFYDQIADNYLARLQDEARANHTDMLIGISVREQGSRRYYNSMLSLGSSTGFYHKRHLVPFGDYVPLEAWLRGLIRFFDLPMSGYSPGPAQQPLLEVAGHKVGVSICYEDVFGEEVIQSLPQAALLVNGTNNAWYGDSFAPHQALQMSRMRALESGRYMLRATTNGISAVIDARGKVVAQSEQFQEDVVAATFQPLTGATPYARWGNYPVVIALLLVLAWTALRGWRGQQNPTDSA